MEHSAGVSPKPAQETTQQVTAKTILAALVRFDCTPGVLGKILKHFRREGPFVGRAFSRQAVWNWAHPESSGWWEVSEPFKLALDRLIRGNGDLREAVELSWPDLDPDETVPPHMAVRGTMHRCACGCGRFLYSSQHWYVNDAHKRAARNKRRAVARRRKR